MAYNSANEEQMRLFAERNSEANHAAALAAAQAEHTRIRENALRVFELEQLRVETENIRQQRIQAEERGRLEIEQLRESNERLRQERIQLEERARLEREKAAEQLRVQQTTSAVPTPPSSTGPPQSAAPPQPTPVPPQAAVQQQPKPTKIVLKTGSHSSSQSSAPATPASANPSQLQQPQLPAFQSNQAQPSATAPASNQLNQDQPASPILITAPQIKPSPQVKANYFPFDHLHPAADRFIEIHKTLKQLRARIKKLGENDTAFRKKAGDMRRAITRSVGQLIEGVGVNKVPVSAPLVVNCVATLTHVTVLNDSHSTQRITYDRPERSMQSRCSYGNHTRPHRRYK
jgi:nucleoporin GLE1